MGGGSKARRHNKGNNKKQSKKNNRSRKATTLSAENNGMSLSSCGRGVCDDEDTTTDDNCRRETATTVTTSAASASCFGASKQEVSAAAAAVDPKDLSSLLFPSAVVDGSTSNRVIIQPWTGPVQVRVAAARDDDDNNDTTISGQHRSSPAIVHGRGLIATRDIAPGECLFVTPAIVRAPSETVRKEWLSPCSATETETDAAQPNEGPSSSASTSTCTQPQPQPQAPSPLSVERVAERVLVRNMRKALDDKDEDPSVARSFLALLGARRGCCGDDTGDDASDDDEDEVGRISSEDDDNNIMDTLLGRNRRPFDDENDDEDVAVLSEEDLLHIVRRNAFGPDFETYAKMQQQWKQQEEQPVPPCCSGSGSGSSNRPCCGTSASTSVSNSRPSRILGLYPLAAMLNHSCIPNAVRVFTVLPSTCSNGDGSTTSTSTGGDEEQEIMMVHASASIREGDEICWSYLPPTQTYPVRSRKLRDQYGFVCRCERCLAEKEIYERTGTGTGTGTTSDTNNNDTQQQHLLSLLDAMDTRWNRQTHLTNLARSVQLRREIISAVEDVLQGKVLQSQSSSSSSTCFSNECKRYLTMGFMHLFVHYLNASLLELTTTSPSAQNNACCSSSQNNNAAGTGSGCCSAAIQRRQEQQDVRNRLLQVTMQLHLACCACNHASTEHLSILHLTYELVGVLHTHAADQSKTLPKVRFWTEQLKRVVQVRYGQLGQNVDAVRMVMQHSRTVLRNQQGLERVPYKFI